MSIYRGIRTAAELETHLRKGWALRLITTGVGGVFYVRKSERREKVHSQAVYTLLDRGVIEWCAETDWRSRSLRLVGKEAV